VPEDNGHLCNAGAGLKQVSRHGVPTEIGHQVAAWIEFIPQAAESVAVPGAAVLSELPVETLH
jgi:hypothetical protein